MAHDLLRAAYILRLQDNEDGALTSEAIVQKHDPKLWMQRESMRTIFDRDLKLQGLHEQQQRMTEQSAQEIEDGNTTKPPRDAFSHG